MKTDIHEHLSIKTQRRNVHISFNGITKLNVLFSEDLKKFFFEIVKSPRTNLVINLSGIHFIDTSMFNTLSFVAKAGAIFGSKLALTEVGTDLMELIDLVKTHSDFTIYKKVEHQQEQLLMAG